MNSDLIYKPRRKALSLTALIDVVFILLMFFMLTTSFTREKQFELASPVASSDAQGQTPRQLLLQANGELALPLGKVGGNHLALTDKDIAADFTHDQPLIIRPAPDANVQAIVSALARLKALGFSQLSLVNPLPENLAGQQP